MSGDPYGVSTDVDGLEYEGIEWPSADAHLRPAAHRDINYIVTIAPNKPNEPAVKKKESPLPLEAPVYAADQVLPSQYFPEIAPQRDLDKELTMDEWDPMKDDFESKSFNSYNRGPSAGLPGSSAEKIASCSLTTELFVWVGEPVSYTYWKAWNYDKFSLTERTTLFMEHLCRVPLLFLSKSLGSGDPVQC